MTGAPGLMPRPWDAPTETLDRSTYLGSSDAAAIMGLSKWKTRLDVYRAKVEPATVVSPEDDADRRKILLRGRLMEPVIRGLAVNEYGLNVTAVNDRHTDPHCPWMRAEVDFEIVADDGEVVNCEAKSVSPFLVHEWGDEDTNEIPLDYWMQVTYALMVSGRARCSVYALFGSDKLVRYIVERDDEMIAEMRAECMSFWHKHVEAKVPPAPTTLEDIDFIFQRVRGRRVEATETVAEEANRYRVLGEQIKQLEEARDAAKLNVAAYILAECQRATGDLEPDEDAELYDPVLRRTLATYKKQRGAYLDQKRLKSEHPNLHADLMVEHWFRVLRPKNPNTPLRKSR